MTGEDGLERGDTVVIGQLDTTEVSRVETTVSVVAASVDTTVDTGGVAVPDIDGDGRDGLTGVDVDVLNLEKDIDTVAPLRLLDVGAHVLADDVIRTISDLGSKDTAGVSREDILEGSEHVVRSDAGLVVVDGLPSLKSSKVTLGATGG